MKVTVSIHAPAWGATGGEDSVLISDCCFNPRARVGRDFDVVSQSGIIIVSIHAPAWGATRVQGVTVAVGTVSIHAPAWGATLRIVDTN